MSNAFEIKRNSPLMAEMRRADRNLRNGRSNTKHVDRERARGVEPWMLELNPNRNNNMLGKKTK